MAELADLYKLLQVDPEADPEVIRAAYRSLARKYHPDVAGGSEWRMVAINQAWAVLGDPRHRAVYDRARLARPIIAPTPSPEPSPAPVEQQPAPAPATQPAPPRPAPRRTGRAGSTVLDFGRYEGWSLDQVARHDPDFLLWLARVPIGRQFRTEIETLLATQTRTATATVERPHRRMGRRH